jgi:undecaprenyl-diphosphatase
MTAEGALNQRQWLWTAAACAVAFAVLTLPIMAGQNWPREWAVVRLALGARSPFWTAVMQAVTFAGSSAVGLGLSVGATAVLLMRDWRVAHRLMRETFLPLVAMLGSAPINFGLRWAIGRYRPGVQYVPHKLPEIAHAFQRWSYPAGHAMTSIICYGVLVYIVLGAARATPRVRCITAGAFILWLCLIGFSRVYLGVHWPSDVIAGYLVGGSWLSACIAALAQPRSVPIS